MTAPRRRTSRRLHQAVPAAVLLMAALPLTSCVTSVTHHCTYGATPVQVRYEVTATVETVDIEILDKEGERVRYRRAATPWRLTVNIPGDTYVRVRAQNRQPRGTITAAIYIDDALWKQEIGIGAVTVETDGVIKTKRGWSCGYGITLQSRTADADKAKEHEGDAPLRAK